ncbi:proton-coupled folate transporter-like isoform X2 [Adelges cooleyi]|uniref:proton-coupled folate transporter-like isoform X2 n=2 Tax=Adelges cooleyi TaxID=133065 RepID=UPI00217F8537|nr:proton-coupled folate transporter-like isoform X2 [Adelges cooleyi]
MLPLKIRTSPLFGDVSNLSLESVTMLFSLSISISAFLQNNLLLRKACNPMEPFGECVNSEKSAQHVVSIIQSWKALFQYTIPIVFIILAGPWSDSHGKRRKPLIFLPIVGQILTDAFCIMNAYFWSWPPQVAAVFEAVTPGLFGSKILFWVGMISYVSDNTDAELRTLRFGVLNATSSISALIGTGLSGILNVKLGFFGAFAVTVVLNSVALAIGYWAFEDTSVPYEKNNHWFKPQYLFKGYLSIFKGKVKHYAITLLVLLVCQSVLVGRFLGEYAVMYLFVRYQFGWQEMEYSYFAAYKMMTIIFGTLFAVSTLSHHLKINDVVIGVIAGIFDIFAAFGYVLIDQPWQMYIIPVIDFFHGTAITIIISLTSKMVEKEELGRMNSAQGLFNTVLSLVIVAFYNATYHFTFEYLTGAVFLLSIILTAPILVVLLIMYYKCRHLWASDSYNIAVR